MKFLFKTTVTMKEYNCKKWWIEGDIVRELTVEADTLEEALVKYKEHVEKTAYIDISKTAMKLKQPMYIDKKSGETVQVGYVITGSSDFDKGNYQGWSKQYVDLWVTIYLIDYVQF